jgi:conjugative transfer signal peptidase TraF
MESIMMAGPLAKLRKTDIGKPGLCVFVGLGVVVSIFQVFSLCGLRINASPSLPVGLYLVTADRSANLVEFCPAEPFATLALSRGYRDPGVCADRGAPLLKPVVAKAGDIVDLSALGISVNGVFLPNTAPLSKDTRDRVLEAWPSGHYRVAPGTVWVSSSYQARSFDSRYFGPIYVAAIRHRLKAFLTL